MAWIRVIELSNQVVNQHTMVPEQQVSHVLMSCWLIKILQQRGGGMSRSLPIDQLCTIASLQQLLVVLQLLTNHPPSNTPPPPWIGKKVKESACFKGTIDLTSCIPNFSFSKLPGYFGIFRENSSVTTYLYNNCIFFF